MKQVSTGSGIQTMKFRIIVMMVVTVGLILSLVLINPLEQWRSIFEYSTFRQAILDLLWFVAMGWVITECSLLVSRWLDPVLPWERKPARRIFIQLFLQMILISLLVTFFLFITFSLLESTDQAMTSNDWLGLQQVLFVSVVLSLLTTGIFTGNHLLHKWRNSLLEAAELKQANLQAQLQIMKAQLNPHFMFNNFSVLSGLISENKDGALQFLDRLSIVYRYMTNNLSRNIISLREELHFIEAYIYLIKIRFADNLHITVNIPAEFEDSGIPPSTLQLLLENAVKHNIASRVQPLFIHIGIQDNNSLVVTNNLQRISYSIPSTELGLQNIINRYKLLSAEVPEIKETEKEFLVKVPLLPLQ